MKTYQLLMACIIFLTAGAVAAKADGLENGDFSHGKSGWTGEGQVVFLESDGTITTTEDSKSTGWPEPADPAKSGQKLASIPIIEIKPHSTQFRDLAQRFRTGKGAEGLNVELVYKGSPDFKLNDKVTAFTKAYFWQPGSLWYGPTTTLVFPKCDLTVRMDKRDGHCYKLLAIGSGGDWQTAKFRWESIGENQDVTLNILTAPAHGTLWVKSVTVSK